MVNTPHRPSEADTSQIIAMAWEDDTPFEAIALAYGLSEAEVIALMRQRLKTGSFRAWRMRVRGRKSKHLVRKNQRAIQALARDNLPPCLMTEDNPVRPSHSTREGLK